jgi:hypothetical protein
MYDLISLCTNNTLKLVRFSQPICGYLYNTLLDFVLLFSFGMRRGTHGVLVMGVGTRVSQVE